MFKSISKAEEAAYNGEGADDWDSQGCRNFQQAILSSSPAPNAVASNLNSRLLNPPTSDDANEDDGHDLGDDQDDDEDDEEGDELQLVLPPDWAPQKSLAKDDFIVEKVTHPDQEPEPAQEKTKRENLVVEPILDGIQSTQQDKKVLKKDSQGRLRLFDHEGNIVQVQRPRFKTMEEDLNGTQKSSMSLTQENPESAYEGYRIPRSIHVQSSNLSAEHSGLRTSKNQSLFTDSTAHTYGENDTGHLAFDMGALEEGEEGDEEPQDEEQESQDPPYVPTPRFPPPFSKDASDEPITPAPVINPFKRKGSVMKGQDLFGATQASSTIRAAFQSPTSSRPSPNIFNEFETPGGLPSSPTNPRGIITSSVPLLHELQNSPVGRSPSQSPAFRTAPENPQSSPPVRPPPRAYVSMKESQERRKMEEAETESDSDSDGSISSIEPDIAKRRAKIAEIIQREISAVETRSVREPSSRPQSSLSAAVEVEVPSTSKRLARRRSLEDDYVAQCTGQDTRDAQQEDIVADSQLAEDDIETAENTQSISHVAESSMPQPKLSANVQPQPAEAADAASQQILPRSQMLPPMGTLSAELVKNLDDMTIPETSPMRSDQIRPMGDIASFTYEGTDDVDMDELPGFTQDVDFDMAVGYSPEASAPQANHPIEPEHKEIGSMPENLASSQSPIRNSWEESAGVHGSSPKPSPQRLLIAKDLEPFPQQSSPDLPMPTIPARVSSKKATRVSNVSMPPLSALGQQPSSSLTSQTSNDPAKAPEHSTTPIPDASSKSTAAVSAPSNIPARENLQPSVVPESSSVVDTPKAVNSVAKVSSPQRNGSLSRSRTPVPSAEPISSALSSVPEYGTDDEIIKAPEDPEENDGSDTEDNPASSASVSPDGDELPTLPKPTPKTTPKSKAKIVTYGKRSASKRPLRGAKSSSPVEDDLAKPSPSLSLAPKSSQKAKATPKGRSNARKSISAISVPQEEKISVSTQTKRASKRKSDIGLIEKKAEPTTTRTSKRKSTAMSLRDSSEDPISLGAHVTSSASKKKIVSGLFSNMAFAVSYVAAESDKIKTSKFIVDNGGQILEDGFDSLFTKSAPTSSTDAKELKLLPAAEKIGFTALIANQHSRKAKYIQALALGLPCISGKWISICVSKGLLVDWSPYLLCAGQSTFLGDACRSRTLQPYPAADAQLVDAFESRDQLLNGKSILLVTGTAKRLESRQAYIFLARALGPSRIGHAIDLAEARKKLTEAENQGEEWDMVYLDKVDKGADATLFEDFPAGGSRKRKRASTAALEDIPAPKRVRVICDETVVQSLILGQLMDD